MKSDIDLLAENPEAMQSFVKMMQEQATVIGCGLAIAKISESLRTQLAAARDTGLDPSALLLHCRQRGHGYLIVSAMVVGAERGERLGAERAKILIEEARRYASNVVAAFAPWMVDVSDNDDPV